MSRAAGVNRSLILPPPPERYDVVDQREVRHLIMQAQKNQPDWSTLTTVPAPVKEVSTHTIVEVQQVFNPARATVTITTAALPSLASEVSIVAMPFTSGALLTIQVDRACWVRFYATSADQTADAVRLQGTLGTAGTGLLAEFQCSIAQTVHVSPVAILANDENVLAKRIWYTITNNTAGTSAVTVTLGVLKLEA